MGDDADVNMADIQGTQNTQDEVLQNRNLRPPG